MLHLSKYINYNKKTSSNNGLEKKYNKAGRNSSGKIVIRFKSKSNIKKILLHDSINKAKMLDFVIFNRKIHNDKSLFSSYILKKDILYPLSILVRNFGYQILKKNLSNFIYFFKRLFFSKELNFKINFYFMLMYIKRRLEFFYNICLEQLHVGQRVKKVNRNSEQESQIFDWDLVKNFYDNNLICNVSYKNKRLFISPLTKGLILNVNKKHTLVLTPQKRILKLPLVSIGQLFGNPYLRKSKAAYKKASNFKFLTSKPRVLGKSMNICDRPNGGYKHSSKLLKNFKSQLICK